MADDPQFAGPHSGASALMPIFEVEAEGKVFEIDAPSIDEAMAAWKAFKPQPSFMEGAVSGIPGEIAKEASSALDAMKRPFSEAAVTDGAVGGLMNTGRALAAIPQMALSPITGAARSLGGRALATASHAIGSYINPQVAARDNPQQMYEELAPQVDKALAAAAPARGGISTLRQPVALPPKEAARVPVPSQDQLLAGGGRGFEAAEAVPHAPFQPEMMRALADNTKQVMGAKRERLAPNTFGLVDDLTKDGTIADLRVTRELLGEVAQSVDKSERRAATIAIKELDKFIERNEPLAGAILADANANYAAGKRVERLTQAGDIAGLRTGRAGYGGNEVNARRQVISPIVEQYIKGNRKGWSPDEVSAMEAFVRGGKGVNTLRTLAQMAPSKHGFGFASPISALTAGASLALGAGAHKLAAILTRREFNQLIEKAAKRSPAYAEAVSQATDRYLAAAQSLTAQPTPAKVAGLISAARALSNGLKFDGVNIGSGELLKRLQAPVPSAAEAEE